MHIEALDPEARMWRRVPHSGNLLIVTKRGRYYLREDQGKLFIENGDGDLKIKRKSPTKIRFK